MAANIRYYLQTVGICSLMHFLVDGLCVCCLYLLASRIDWHYIVGVFITYNVLAFLTQPLTGWYVDKVESKHWVLLVSILFLTMAVTVPWLMFLWPSFGSSAMGPFLMATLLGIGNSLFHVWGGKQTVLKTDNDIRAVGTFVSTGAFGLSVGIVFHSWFLLYTFLLAICLLAVMYVRGDSIPDSFSDSLSGNGTSDGKGSSYAPVAVWIAMAALMAFVMFRSFLGETFSGGHGKEGVVVLAVGAISMLGKMMGGWLSKWWGIVAAMVFILAVVLLCSMLRDLHEAFSFVGLFIINCTMPITLYLANVVMRGKEGLAFGLLAAALMPGYLLSFILLAAL